MYNDDASCLRHAKSDQMRIPGSSPRFRNAASAMGDPGRELSHVRTAHRNVALGDHLGTRLPTLLPDGFSRGRPGWRVRSPPLHRAPAGRQVRRTPRARCRPGRATGGPGQPPPKRRLGDTAASRRAVQISEGLLRDVDGFGHHLADDFVEHEVTPSQDSTRAGTKDLITMMMAAFPDLRFDAEDVISSDDKVVARTRVTGTNTGTLMGMPPTGKSVNVQVIDIQRFGDDGLVREHWGVMNSA